MWYENKNFIPNLTSNLEYNFLYTYNLLDIYNNDSVYSIYLPNNSVFNSNSNNKLIVLV